LTPSTETKTVAGEESQASQDLKGAIAVYMVKAAQQGYAETTIEHNIEIISWMANNAGLNDPVKAWHAIEKQKGWKDGTKQRAASAYKSFCKISKISIPEDLDFNKWVHPDSLPSYIPTENEVLQLISGTNRKTAAFLQLLYETGIRSGEAWRLKWLNFDFERKTLTLSADVVEKKGTPRQFKVSDNLIAMLNQLPKKTEYIWNNKGRSLESFRSSFCGQRKHLAFKLQTPNLMKIKLHTFRHFYACKLYHLTKDILLVKEKLGHRNIQNTMVYTRLVDWEQPDNWVVKRPQTSQEEDELITVGFEYVRFDEQLNTPIYRKRK
jgi:integrase